MSSQCTQRLDQSVYEEGNSQAFHANTLQFEFTFIGFIAILDFFTIQTYSFLGGLEKTR